MYPFISAICKTLAEDLATANTLTNRDSKIRKYVIEIFIPILQSRTIKSVYQVTTIKSA